MKSEISMIELNNDTIDRFLSIVPSFQLSGFDTGEAFGIGAMDDTDNTPVGALVFSYSEEKDNKDSAHAPDESNASKDSNETVLKENNDNASAVLRWLYVDEDYRGNGIGNELFEIFKDTISSLNVKRITCELYDRHMNEDVRGFLENKGFSVSHTLSNHVLISQSQIYNVELLRKGISGDGVKRLSELDRTEEKKVYAYNSNLKKEAVNIGKINKELSLALFDHNNEVGGVLFVECDRFMNIKPVRMNSIYRDNKAADALLKLVAFESGNLLNSGYEGSWINIDVKQEKVLKLAEYFLPVNPLRDAYLCSMNI